MQATASQGLSEGVRVPPCLSEPASAGWGGSVSPCYAHRTASLPGPLPAPRTLRVHARAPWDTALPLNPSSEGAESLNCHFFSSMGPEDTKNKPAD